MEDILGTIFQSGNIFLIIFISLLIFVSVKLGLFKYKSDKITFGRDAGETERSIIRTQSEYAYRACQAFFNQIPRFDGFDDFRAKYIIELCFDELTKWVNYNHIEDKESYIEVKQDIIWNIVQTNITNDKLKSKQFRKQIDEYVANIIKKLVCIRNEYN